MINLLVNLINQLIISARKHAGAIAPITLAAIYVFSFKFNGLLDMPNHLVRSYIMKTCFLDSTNPLCANYIVSFVPSTFILSDLTLVGYLLLFPPLLAEKFALFFALASFILSWYVLYRRINGTINIGYLAGLLLILNNYIYNGFYAYILSVTGALVWLYFWWGIKDNKTILNQIILSLAMAPIFAFHLAGFLFIFMIYAFYELQKKYLEHLVSWKSTFIDTCKSIPVIVMFFGLLLAQGIMDKGNSSAVTTYSTVYRSALNKVAALAFPFVNYSRIDLIITSVFFMVLVFSIDPTSYRRIKSNFWAQVSLLFFISFMVAPVEINGIYDFDVRFLPIAYLSLFIAIGLSTRKNSFYTTAICIVLLVSFGTSMYYKNMTNQQLIRIYNMMNFCQRNESLVEINSIRNYPVNSGSRVSPFPYFSQYNIINNGGLVGGLFNCKANRNISYFCYANNGIMPLDYARFHFWGITAVDRKDLIKLAAYFDYILLIGNESEDYIYSKIDADIFTLIRKDGFIYLFQNNKKRGNTALLQP